MIRFVFAINERDVWFDPWFHWDGQQFSELPIDPIFIGVRWNKMWGTASGELYVVGDYGGIAYSPDHGLTWRRLESGTTVNLNDIWGRVDTRTGKRTILCAAADPFSTTEKKILQLKQDNTVDSIPWVAGNRAPNSLWFQRSTRVFVCGDGVFVRRPDAVWREIIGLTTIPYFTERLRGNATNDWFVVGDFGTVAHWNGATAGLYPEAAAALYYSCDYKRDLLVAVGVRNARAVALQMRR